MAPKVVPCVEDSPRARQQRSNAIKPEESASGFRVGQLLDRHAFHRVKHSAIHRETVCVKQVRKSAIPRQSSKRVFAASPIPDHVRFGQFGHVVFEADSAAQGRAACGAGSGGRTRPDDNFQRTRCSSTAVGYPPSTIQTWPKVSEESVHTVAHHRSPNPCRSDRRDVQHHCSACPDLSLTHRPVSRHTQNPRWV